MRTSYTTLAIIVLFLTYNLARAQHLGTMAAASHLNEALRYELLMMRDDIHGLQRSRLMIERKFGLQSIQYKKITFQIKELDKQHSARILAILTEYGWPGYQQVGQDGAQALWLVVQRLDKETLKICAPFIVEAALAGEADKFQAAVLQDRALLMNGKKQWYGTQLYADVETGKLALFPVADEANIDKRRLEMGLEPHAEYLQKYQVEHTQTRTSGGMEANAD